MQKRSASRPETEREKETRTRREAEIVTTRCRLCDANYEGPLVDGRRWHVLHLRDAHPDFEPTVTPPGNRRKRSK